MLSEKSYLIIYNLGLVLHTLLSYPLRFQGMLRQPKNYFWADKILGDLCENVRNIFLEEISQFRSQGISEKSLAKGELKLRM